MLMTHALSRTKYYLHRAGVGLHRGRRRFRLGVTMVGNSNALNKTSSDTGVPTCFLLPDDCAWMIPLTTFCFWQTETCI